MSEDDRRTMAGPPPEGWRLPKDASVVLPDEEEEYKVPEMVQAEDGSVKWENVTLEATLHDSPVMAKKIEQDAEVDKPWPYSFPYRPGDKVPPELVEEGMKRLEEAGFERVSGEDGELIYDLPELPYAVSMTKEEYEKYISIQEAINDFVSRQEKILCSHGTPAIKNDEITHPAHYTSGSIETIDFIQDKELNFALGNVIKYVVRADLKGNPIGDLKKARQYLDFEIEDRTRKSLEND